MTMQLHIYANQGNIAGVAKELKKGNKIDCRDKCASKTPLMYAIVSPEAGVDMVQYLVDHGADVNRMEKRTHQSLLSLAVQAGNP